MAEAEEDQQFPVLAAFGNPLLDIILPDEEGQLVDTFRLQRDIAQEVDTVAIGLYDRVSQEEEEEVEYSGGGCALNTVRVFQWLTGRRHSSVFLGGLGNDRSGRLLQDLVEADGVRTGFAVQPDEGANL